MSRRARGLCPVCASDVAQNPGGGARKHYRRGQEYSPYGCPGTGQPLVAIYEPDDPPRVSNPHPVRETAPNPALTAEIPAAPPPDAARIRALRDELARTGTERDRYRAENMSLAHTARMLLDANRHMLDAADLSDQANAHLRNAQRRLLDSIADTLPAYPND